MNQLSLFDLNKVYPYAVGFDKLFDKLYAYSQNQMLSTGFPPYNIRKEGETKIFIDLAVAGLSRKDLEVEVVNNTLIIRSTYDSAIPEPFEFLHKGISYKKFTRNFTLADEVIVKEATYKDGMLTIELERLTPEVQKSKLIPIK